MTDEGHCLCLSDVVQDVQDGLWTRCVAQSGTQLGDQFQGDKVLGIVVLDAHDHVLFKGRGQQFDLEVACRERVHILSVVMVVHVLRPAEGHYEGGWVPERDEWES